MKKCLLTSDFMLRAVVCCMIVCCILVCLSSCASRRDDVPKDEDSLNNALAGVETTEKPNVDEEKNMTITTLLSCGIITPRRPMRSPTRSPRSWAGR